MNGSSFLGWKITPDLAAWSVRVPADIVDRFSTHRNSCALTALTEPG